LLLPAFRDRLHSLRGPGKGQGGGRDRAGALQSSRNARMWAWISFGSGLVLGVGYLILVLVGALAQS